MAKSWFDVIPQSDFKCDILDKDTMTFNHIMYMLNRTNQMFEYSGLPDTIPAYMLELYLQAGRMAAFAEFPGNSDYPAGLYILNGGLGGPPDPYYRPTLWVGANPALKWSYSLVIGTECVIIKNDTLMRGLLPLFARYATQMTENEISIRSAQINSRQRTIISASTESEMESADMYMDELVAGRLAAIGEKPFLEGIKVFNAGSSQPNTIIQLIELEQYLKASWYNELGLNNSFSMKREYVSAEEIASNDDILLPMVDDMLRCRREAIEKVNLKYGLHITVDKNSSWKNKELEADEQLRNDEDGSDKPDESPSDT